MKRFVFSLESLLETKLALEEAAQRRLADGLRALQTAREALHRLLTLIHAESEKIERLSGRQTDKQELMQLVRYRTALQQEARQQAQQTMKCEAAAARLREQMRQAMIERKNLENLKAVEYKTWAQERRRLEQKDLDEIAIQRFLRGTTPALTAAP